MPQLFDQLTYCREWLEAALSHGDQAHTFDDIAAGVLTGRYRLWVSPKGCAVTEIQVYPRKKVLNIFLAGGDMDAIKGFAPACDEYARNMGCSDLVLTGRKGWVRAAPEGWQVSHTTMKRSLT